MPRIGILGGAFNPPHLGHLVCAQEAFAQLALDRLVLIPIGHAPHRAIEPEPGPEARLAMTELAVRDDPRFSVSRVETDRDGPSYTADTLAGMRAQAPEAELVLVLGADQASKLPDWHEPERVLALATIAVAARSGFDDTDVSAALAGLAGAERLRFIDMPLLDISSSEIRRRAGRGEPIRYLVPDAVAGYVAERGLYALGERAGVTG